MRLVKLFWIETDGKWTGVGYEIESKKQLDFKDVKYEPIADDNVGMVYLDVPRSEMRENYFVIFAKDEDE